MEIFDALQLNDFSEHIGEHFKFVVRASFSHHPKAGKNIFGCSWMPSNGAGHFSKVMSGFLEIMPFPSAVFLTEAAPNYTF